MPYQLRLRLRRSARFHVIGKWLDAAKSFAWCLLFPTNRFPAQCSRSFRHHDHFLSAERHQTGVRDFHSHSIWFHLYQLFGFLLGSMPLSPYFPAPITVRHPENVLPGNAVVHLAGSEQIARIKFVPTIASHNWAMESVT